MPNREVHTTAGILSGAMYAYFKAVDEPDSLRLIESIGGAIGGYVGGRLPDIIDPPVSPLHRQEAHSVGVIVGIAKVTRPHLLNLGATCRSQAAKFQSRAETERDSVRRLLLNGLAILFRMLAGFISGVCAGYISHLALDSFSPAGLPLLPAPAFGE